MYPAAQPATEPMLTFGIARALPQHSTVQPFEAQILQAVHSKVMTTD